MQRAGVPTRRGGSGGGGRTARGPGVKVGTPEPPAQFFQKLSSVHSKCYARSGGPMRASRTAYTPQFCQGPKALAFSYPAALFARQKFSDQWSKADGKLKHAPRKRSQTF